MKTIRFSLMAMMAAALVSCVPEERVWWSPDGKVALVRDTSALHLADASGSLGPALDLGGEFDTALPNGVDWLADGSGFVFARVRPAANWEEAKKVVPEVEAEEVEALAKLLVPLLEAAIEASDDKSLAAVFSSIPLKSSPLTEAAGGLAWERESARVTKLLEPLPDAREVLDEFARTPPKIKVHEICHQRVANGRAEGPPKALTASLRGQGMVRISPDGKLVAFFREGTEEKTQELVVLPLEGGQEMSFPNGPRLSFDWTPDSTALVLARPVAGDGPLSSIDRVPVYHTNGKLLGSGANAAFVCLAQAVLLDPPMISVLPDGRVLFASTPGTWPAAGSNVKAMDPKLYLAAADGSGVVEIPCAPGTLPTDLRFHALSPDGKKAVLVESGSSVVAVVDLATGSVQMIEPRVENWENHTLPAWRGNDEFTFCAVREGKPTAVRWNAKSGVEPWSSNWAEATGGPWMRKP